MKFQNWVPGRNFLKYGENKKSHVFTIDNTNALKKNVHNLRMYKLLLGKFAKTCDPDRD